MRRLTEAERHGRLWTYNSGCRCQLCSAASQDYRRRRYLADPKSAGEWKQAHPEFEVWSGAKRRCTDPTRHDYANYGGRGIEMRLTYAEFLAEVGPRPSPAYSIDRIDTDGHYEAGNLRWATRVEQRNNRRNNVSRPEAKDD
jgi:hypothetical protein